MMQELTTSTVCEEKAERLFDFIDKFAQTRGASVPQIVEIEKLRSLRERTFGRAWADFLDENNLQPLTTGMRRKQLHDGIHVLTGYGSDSIGEAEVQAFLLGAKFGLINLLIGIGLLQVIHKRLGHQTKEAKQRMWQAYQRGKNLSSIQMNGNLNYCGIYL